MKLAHEDVLELTTLYKNVLIMLKNETILQNITDFKDVLSYINSVYHKLIEAHGNEEIEPVLSNLPNYGILSLGGYQTCRSANTFLYDFLSVLDLNASKQYIFVDENNDWRRVEKRNANHLVVSTVNNGYQMYLDLFNGIFFDSNLKAFNIDSNVYVDEEKYIKSINQIRLIINRYKHLQNLGINYIYNYKQN